MASRIRSDTSSTFQPVETTATNDPAAPPVFDTGADASNRLDLPAQYAYLSSEVYKVRTRLQGLQAGFETLETELNSFYLEYENALGGLLSRLAWLEEQLEDPDYAPGNHQAARLFTAQSKPNAKHLYRKLVKSVHPDISPNEPDAMDAFRLIQSLYEKSDVETLRLIDGALAGELPEVDGVDEEERIIRLENLLDALNRKCDHYLRALHTERNSSLYTLFLEARESELLGEPFFERLAEIFEQEITEKEKQLRLRKPVAIQRIKTEASVKP